MNVTEYNIQYEVITIWYKICFADVSSNGMDHLYILVIDLGNYQFQINLLTVVSISVKTVKRYAIHICRVYKIVYILGVTCMGDLLSLLHIKGSKIDYKSTIIL